MATNAWQPSGAYVEDAMGGQIVRGPVRTLPLFGGRLIFGGFFLYAGLHHLIDLPVLSAAAAQKGIWAPQLAVAGSGVIAALGGLSLLAGFWPRIGASLILLFLIGVTPTMHAFWLDAPGPEMEADLGHFIANLALMGGACFAAALPAPWPAWTGAWRGRARDRGRGTGGFTQGGPYLE